MSETASPEDFSRGPRIDERFVGEYQALNDALHLGKPVIAYPACGEDISLSKVFPDSETYYIDTNEESIKYARQMFERIQNNIYYTPQVTFDVVDVTDEERGLSEFDYVTCIEVIEHIPRTEAVGLLKFLNRFVKKGKNGQQIVDQSKTKIFLSTPNRNSPTLGQDTPRNEHHCYEASAAEMYAFLTQHYQAVTVLDENLVPQELGTTATPLVFKLEMPL